jgi:hypothetical protein
MDWLRKSRNSKIGLTGVLGLVWLCPQLLWAYGYSYMKDYQERINRSAAMLYFSEDRNAPHLYEEMGPVKKKSDTRANCVTRLRRQAWQKKADGIVQVKYSAEILSNQITCEGIMIRWKGEETQPAETQPEAGAVQGSETQSSETKTSP